MAIGVTRPMPTVQITDARLRSGAVASLRTHVPGGHNDTERSPGRWMPGLLPLFKKERHDDGRETITTA